MGPFGTELPQLSKKKNEVHSTFTFPLSIHSTCSRRIPRRRRLRGSIYWRPRWSSICCDQLERQRHWVAEGAISVSNRTVVFAVGGVINISSRLVFKSHQTIAGQTAPGVSGPTRV